ncbi:hypothetical protein [Prevotella sp. S7 MS 2]|uniref:hypothetical protein n=1 Tax=Prevotella sp. S7 MS 2 TaxID=1287488 RepID=UPI0005132666|nr:hypothetical protein [Prevotella sp. S7 MS 2]KGI59860.1 hypothetical protein HMPREF0671_09290 [Prevotella sp. S7 MS 2]
MKRNFLKTAAFLFMGIIATMAFTACSNDPENPQDERKNKLHEDPAKMEIQLVECHLHTAWENIQEVGGPHQNTESDKTKYMKKIQTITYQNVEGKGWQLAEGSPKKFYVMKNGEYYNENGANKEFQPAPVYLLFIKYYNTAGKLINQEFMTEDQARIHQHFFTPVNVKSFVDGKPETDNADKSELVDYLYTDTTPWDGTKHEGTAKITGKENPVGFKGVIRFLKNDKEFDLRIRLYHGYKGKTDPKTNKFCPFNKPSGSLIQAGTWDVNVDVPFIVYMDRNEMSVDVDEDADLSKLKESDFDEDSNPTLHRIMKAFGITWAEALHEYYYYTYTPGHGKGGIWL